MSRGGKSSQDRCTCSSITSCGREQRAPGRMPSWRGHEPNLFELSKPKRSVGRLSPTYWESPALRSRSVPAPYLAFLRRLLWRDLQFQLTHSPQSREHELMRHGPGSAWWSDPIIPDSISS